MGTTQAAQNNRGRGVNTRETIRGLCVLVVDDEATSRNALADQLRSCGIHARCVGTAQDALQELVDATISNQPFEVALLDYQMPECDGEQLGRLIRTYDRLTSTRLILLASSAYGNEQRAAELGFAAILKKPTTERHLAACLAKVTRVGAAAANEPDTHDGLIDLATARVITISAYRAILRLLKQDPALIRQLGPEALEAFVRERIEVMGYTCSTIGSTRQSGGGIDLIACPIKTSRSCSPYRLRATEEVGSRPLLKSATSWVR